MANSARFRGVSQKDTLILTALVQGIAFINSVYLFTNFFGFIYNYLMFFVLGLMASLIYLRTGRFWPLIVYIIPAFLLRSNTDFFKSFFLSLPESLGVYNTLDSNFTTAELIARYFGYAQIALLIIGPVVALILYQESWFFIKSVYNGFKNNYKAYGIVFLTFFVIDIIFSFITTQANSFGIIGLVIGFVIALIILRFVINAIFSVLPAPSKLHQITEDISLNEKYPINISNDIKFLEKKESLFLKPQFLAPLVGVFYIYLLFVTGTYRNLEVLDFENIIRSIFFFAVLPLFLFVISTFSITKAIKRGYFFQESWRRKLYFGLFIVFLLNILIWVRDTSTSNFSWAVIPLFMLAGLTIWPKPVSAPLADFSKGLLADGRNATFNWLKHSPELFIEVHEKLLKSNLNQVVVGAYIAASKLDLFQDEILIDTLSTTNRKPETIGIIIALGNLPTSNSSKEEAISKHLTNEDNEIKKVAFWALGKIGTKNVLPKMVDSLSETQNSSIVKVAEQAILRIDPEYPISGIRDKLTLAL